MRQADSFVDDLAWFLVCGLTESYPTQASQSCGQCQCPEEGRNHQPHTPTSIVTHDGGGTCVSDGQGQGQCDYPAGATHL